MLSIAINGWGCVISWSQATASTRIFPEQLLVFTPIVTSMLKENFTTTNTESETTKLLKKPAIASAEA